MSNAEKEDALDALSDALDAIDVHVRVADARVKRTEKYRLSMLHVHAIMAMLIAPLFMAIGRVGMRGPTWVTARLIPGAPYTLGVFLFAGGMILAVATWYRAIRWEMFGLWILLCWYASISISFGAAVVLWIHHGALDGPTKPALYSPVVYLHYVCIMAVHLGTLFRLRRLQRRPK
jgi:hypothetical protein